ncbi:MAG: S8 family serine peptidase [Pseudomonadota bacterium]|nr:S8 family serine peptidase [Pseudomonadota bacterium]
MKRIAMLIAVAALLNACGGGSDQAESQATVSNQLTTARTSANGSLISGAGHVDSAGSVYAIEFGAVALDRISASLRGAKGSIDVWVALKQPPAAARQAARIDATGAKLVRGESTAALAAVDAEQTSTMSLLASLGVEVLGRVRLSHNAIAVRVDAAQLPAISSIGNVVSVNPVIHPVLALSEVVPYVGAAAAQAVGKDGHGTRIAVLDSGIDYTHAAFGGPGTVAAYVAAAGVNPSNPAVPTTDPRATTLDGLFPTAKVIGGYDFVGEGWPFTPRTEDPDPIDRQGHGTSVGHIAAGFGGVAPGASLYAVKVCSAVSSSCNGVALLLGVDFALDPNGDGEIDDAVDVINMSLGTAYGQIEDDLTQASSNASRAGVVVVAAAGNNADHPYIVSSPSISAEAISVAQTQIPSALARFAALTVSPPPAGQPNPNTNVGIQDWALPSTSPTAGQLVFVGRGCPADPALGIPVDDPYVPVPVGAPIAGSILLIDRGACNASLKVDRAAKAGAVGVIIADNVPGTAPPIFGFGGGTNIVPTISVTQAYGIALKVLLPTVPAVKASFQLTAEVPLVGGIVASSARGPSISKVSIKPEIGAPGASLAAAVGTGTGVARFGGTSGATPVIAGAAAIMKQVHPTRSPMIIKALLMNSAETQIRTNPAASAELAPITRIGAGELRVDRALALEAVAFVPKDKSAALSFGFHAVSTTAEFEREVRVVNLSRRSKTFSIASSFRFANDQASGAVALSMPSSITVGGRGSANFTVKMTIDASKLPAWTMTNGNISGSGPALTPLEFDGYVTLQSDTDDLSLPWHVLPRRAPAVMATPRNAVVGNPITLANPSVTNGFVDVFALTAVSPRVGSDLPDPGDNFAIVDLRAVGLRAAGAATAPVVQFAINTFGARSHPNYPAEFDILIDANRDGTADYVVYNIENGGFGVTGQSVVAVANLATPTVPARVFFFSGGGLNTGNMILTVPLSALAPVTPGTGPSVTLGQPFDFQVAAYDNYFTGELTDFTDMMTHTLSTPRFAAAADVLIVGAGTAGLLGTSAPAGGATASPSQLGLLLIYTAADLKREADIIRLRERRR